jgi:hypothetical protein
VQLGKLFIGLMVAVGAPAIAQPASTAKPIKPTNALVDQIRRDCGITSQHFTYDDEGISFQYDGMIEDEKVDCARDRTALLGVGFEAYDQTASYSGPRRFIIKGPPKRLEALAAEASAAGWTITHRSDAGGEMTFLEIETGANFTRREVRAFMDRFIMGDLRDIAVGLAPTSLAGYDLPATATDFRLTARRMYETLGTRSCGTPPGFDRDALLKPDHAAVAQLEQELSASVASAHLAIAKEDAAYELSKKPDSCWDDDDVRFANRHVEMVHDSVSAGSSRLRLLAPMLGPLPTQPSPSNAAEFRYRVRQLAASLLPLCKWTEKGTNEQVLAASSAEMHRFRASLRDSPYAAHFDIAEKDARYQRSQVTAECDDPGSEPVSKLSEQAVTGTRKQIQLISKLTSS